MGASSRYTLRSVTTPSSTAPSRQTVNTDGGWKTMTVSREWSRTASQGDACCALARPVTASVSRSELESGDGAAKHFRRHPGLLHHSPVTAWTPTAPRLRAPIVSPDMPGTSSR